MKPLQRSNPKSRKRTKHVLLQVAKTWKEPFFRPRKWNRLVELEIKEFHCADEVSRLKKPVSLGLDAFRERRGKRRDRGLEYAANLRLPVVVVYLDSIVGREPLLVLRYEFRYLQGEGTGDCGRICRIAFVDREGMVANRRVECERKKSEEKLASQVEVHRPKVLLAADERAGVDAEPRKTETVKSSVDFGEMRIKGFTLVVEHERHYVEARWDDGRVKTTGLVHEHAQLFLCGHAKIKLAGRYPRRRVARAFASARNFSPDAAYCTRSPRPVQARFFMSPILTRPFNSLR